MPRDPVALPLLMVTEEWSCPNCDMTDTTRGLPPNSARFHVCAGLHMLTAPLVRAGVRCKVEAEERADYLGREIQATGDDGRPYMAVRTTRADGDDLAVNAALARAGTGALPVTEQQEHEETPAVYAQAQAATATSSVSPGPEENED
jgi:hypothetical protein